MSLIEKRVATVSDLKWFGVILAGCFGVLGTLSWLRGHHTPAAVLWSIGGALALLYYAVRPLQSLMFDLWMGITYPIGWVVSNLTLTLMFYFVVTPLGLIMRLCGRGPMERRFDRVAVTYWRSHDPGQSTKRYFHQI